MIMNLIYYMTFGYTLCAFIISSDFFMQEISILIPAQYILARYSSDYESDNKLLY